MENNPSSISNRKGSSFVALMAVVVIMGIVLWMLMRTKQPNENNGTMMKEAGIDTSSRKAILDSAKRITQDASKPKQ